MLSKDQLENMKSVNIENCELDSLIDISSICVNPYVPYPQKIDKYIHQIKNPYCFRYNDMPIKVRYVSTTKTLEESLSEYFIHR